MSVICSDKERQDLCFVDVLSDTDPQAKSLNNILFLWLPPQANRTSASVYLVHSDV